MWVTNGLKVDRNGIGIVRLGSQLKTIWIQVESFGDRKGSTRIDNGTDLDRNCIGMGRDGTGVHRDRSATVANESTVDRNGIVVDQRGPPWVAHGINMDRDGIAVALALVEIETSWIQNERSCSTLGSAVVGCGVDGGTGILQNVC